MTSTTSHHRSHVHDTVASEGQVLASINNKVWECWCNGIYIYIYTFLCLGCFMFEYYLRSRVNWAHFWIFSVLTDLWFETRYNFTLPDPCLDLLTVHDYIFRRARPEGKSNKTGLASNVTLRRIQRHHCCRGKTKIIAYSESVSVVLVILHAKCVYVMLSICSIKSTTRCTYCVFFIPLYI
jgi:hypothetical protein